MPQDFYDFWDFCKVLNPVAPEGTLMCRQSLCTMHFCLASIDPVICSDHCIVIDSYLYMLSYETQRLVMHHNPMKYCLSNQMWHVKETGLWYRICYHINSLGFFWPES